MSNCRCNDIHNCKSKIEKLSYIRNALIAMEAQVTNLNHKVNGVSEKGAPAYEGMNAGELKGIIMDLDNEICSVKNDFQTDVSNRIQNLKNDLYYMENEDDKYHEEKRLAMLALQEGETNE